MDILRSATPKSRSVVVVSAFVLAVAAACSSDKSTGPNPSSQLSPQVAAMVSDGFATSMAGFSLTDNSFSASSDMFNGFRPLGWGESFGWSFGWGDRFSDLMGGGLGPDFMGEGLLFNFEGAEFDGGPFAPRDSGSGCTFSSSTGRVTCPPRTFRGLTITRSFAFTDTSGKPQSAPNGATNTVNTQVTVMGTVVTHHRIDNDNDTTQTSDTTQAVDSTTVNQSSDRTVSGLVRSATKRVVNGISGGTEKTVGTTGQGVKFTTSRSQGDTTAGLTIPVKDHWTSFPVAGTVSRVMTVDVQVTGKAEAKSFRREMITYDSTGVAHIVITHDTTTKTCTLQLPHGHLTCS